MEDIRYKILLIEDDKLDQMAFMRMVEDRELPYDCTVAGSVSEAHNILGSQQFDIVIADYSLGDGTAFDVLDSVKDTPLILVTGAGDEEVAIKAWKAGAYDYLIKDHERNYLKTVPITVENAIKHKKAEAKLRLLSGAITSTDDSVYITDMENKIIFVNRAFCEAYGYKKEEIIGKDSNILWMGKPQSEYARGVFQTVGSAWEVGFYHKRKDGSVFPVSLSRSIIKDSNEDNIAVVGVARDISQRIIVEDELRTANLKLERRNQLKSELAITVSEELKTPLAALKNILSNAQTGAGGEITPKLQENLELAEKEIDRIKRIVSNFLGISKIETGKIQLQKTKVDLQEVVSEATFLLTDIAAEKNIKLLAALPPDSGFAVYADRGLVMQILMNLIDSVINFTPVGQTVSVTVSDLENEVQINMQDTGTGISNHDISKIFNRFVQVDEYAGPGSHETGLGLYIAKHLVRAHGGRIWAESKPDRGNIFCFTLTKYREQTHAGVAEPVKIFQENQI